MNEQSMNEIALALQSRFDSDLRTLPPDLRAEFSLRTGTCGFGEETSMTWAERFSPLVLLYPLYQAQGLPTVPARMLESVARAHVYFLVFSVLDDRRRDGQILGSSGLSTLTGWLLERGLALLGEVAATDVVRDCAMEVADRYERSMVRLSLVAKRCEPLEQSGLRELTIGRSYWGFLATSVLLRGRGADKIFRLRARGAFESLVWGLQWCDDLEDWEEDLRTGDHNLLLDSCAPNLRRHGSRFSLRGPALDALKHEVVPQAIEEARAAFSHAATLQEGIGCQDLADAIRSRIGALARRRADALRNCRQWALCEEIVGRALT